ncbi:MAG: metal ABC transporter ATP-binding protein [Infirmifilum uzonense]|uniref:metal ABC transporter ATP-binding protein n=1 Tax=Infirmifilum uzonense TaxID=1550241 RepID=UPI0023552F85
MHETLSLEIRDLTFSYNSEQILENENIRLEGFGLFTVLGPNGAGKTTFFKVILGLLKPLSGRVLVNGEEITGNPSKAGRYMAYVPQLSNIDYNYPMTGREFIEAGLRARGTCKKRDCKMIVDDYLALVGAQEFADKRMSSLSGGQVQRILVARALSMETPILLLDEPFSGIDPRGKDDILSFIRKVKQNKMILLTTHDPVLTVNLSEKIIVFNRGVKAAGPPAEIFRLDLLRKAYGENVLFIEKCLHIIH